MPSNSPAYMQIGFQALPTDQGPLPSPFVGGTSACDLNGDGSVNVTDLQSEVNAILAASTSSAFDINKDTQVNVLDAQVLTNVILGKASCP